VPDAARSARYPTDLPAWQGLKDHVREDLKGRSLRDLFAKDKGRAGRYTATAGDLVLDYSRNYLTAKTLRLLVQLARQADVHGAVEAMVAGERINETEGRAALHVALRSKLSDRVALDVPGVRDIWQVLDRIGKFVQGVHEGRILGHSGERLTNIVNIGIGGSDLGLVMGANALKHHARPGMRFYPVSNVDGTQLADLTKELDPARTLFVVCSKTFTTLETMTNARAARAWVAERLGERAICAHFVAASTNHEAMDEFDIHPDYRFGFWDWVGGRYSIWSAVGLALALFIGFDKFEDLLAGGRRMDLHFRQAPPEENLPMLLALIGLWYNNFHGAETHAILPYDNRLDRFPAYLQQLQMESSGKSVRLGGRPVKARTGQVIWGESGSNAQHSFYQLLHQGTRFVPIDFILPVRSSGATQGQQDLAIANCLAQSEALMDGYSVAEVEADLVASGKTAKEAAWLSRHKAHVGGRPSNTILMPELSPNTLGQLIALYEHKVFVESAIWNINPFDQWGVELGKRLASGLADAVSGRASYDGENPSIRTLLDRISRYRDEA